MWGFQWQQTSYIAISYWMETNNVYSYTTWKVDGATPMYRFIMAPYKSPHFGTCAICFHRSVSERKQHWWATAASKRFASFPFQPGSLVQGSSYALGRMRRCGESWNRETNPINIDGRSEHSAFKIKMIINMNYKNQELTINISYLWKRKRIFNSTLGWGCVTCQEGIVLLMAKKLQLLMFGVSLGSWNSLNPVGLPYIGRGQDIWNSGVHSR